MKAQIDATHPRTCERDGYVNSGRVPATVDPCQLQYYSIRVRVNWMLHVMIRCSVSVERRTKRLALGFEKLLPGPAWLSLGKTGPPFSPSLVL